MGWVGTEGSKLTGEMAPAGHRAGMGAASQATRDSSRDIADTVSA